MKLYLQEDLVKFEGITPFFTHPYEHWKSYPFKPIELLEEMADELTNCQGFCERILQARKNVKDPLNFFGFITELKVAGFLKKSNCVPEFIVTNNNPSPDFKLSSGLYIEVYTIQKYFSALNRAEDELQNIDHRFRFKRRMALPPTSSIDWQEYFPKLKTEVSNWKGKPLTRNPQPLSGDWETENLVAELHACSVEYEADIHNAHGNPANTVVKYLEEAIKYKSKENDLINRHSNVLWLEFLYLQEELSMSNWSTFDFSKIDIPIGLDSIVVSVCGIDCGYHNCEKYMLLLNERNNTETSDKIKNWFNELNWLK